MKNSSSMKMLCQCCNMSQLGFQWAHIIASYKRTLDQLVWLCALHSAGQSSNPLRDGFVGRRRRSLSARWKKSLVCPTPKHRSKASPVSRELRCRCVWVGQRFEGFLDLRENVFFFLSIMPRDCYTPASPIFFYIIASPSDLLYVSNLVNIWPILV